MIKSANACYSGGGIYIYYGETSDGNFFLASDGFDSIEILDSNPDSNFDEALNYEWQQKHLVREITEEHEARIFWNSMITWIVNNRPDGNYSPEELKKRMKGKNNVE